jgi:hypothetical protein
MNLSERVISNRKAAWLGEFSGLDYEADATRFDLRLFRNYVIV